MQTIPTTPYIVIRIAQRLSLLMAGLFTVLIGSFLVSESVILEAVLNLKNYQGYTDPNRINATINSFIADFSWVVALAVGVGVVLTASLLCFKTQRDADRKTIIDSFVILAFCLSVTVFSQEILTAFINHLAN